MKTKDSQVAVTRADIKRIAAECGFELAGIAPVGRVADFERYRRWVEAGMAGRMSYLTDHRAGKREDPRNLLPSARSVLCVGKLYNTEQPDISSIEEGRGWISRYAWGEDYHTILRQGLEMVVERLRAEEIEFEFKICVDTAPLLERSLARQAGLGWIGKNTCLINQDRGSWFFLGEVLLSLDLEPDAPPPDRCGTCTRCIDACPTQAIVEDGAGSRLDARRCISYLTIELKGPMPEDLRAGVGAHIFGCDICQDVCPWNGRAPVTADERLAASRYAPEFTELARMSAGEFQSEFAASPIQRARHEGFLRNVLTGMGNAPRPEYRETLERLAMHPSAAVAEHAKWALTKTVGGPDGPPTDLDLGISLRRTTPASDHAECEESTA